MGRVEASFFFKLLLFYFKEVPLWRSLCIFYLLTCQVRDTVGDLGLGCVLVTFLSANFTLVFGFYSGVLGLILFQIITNLSEVNT